MVDVHISDFQNFQKKKEKFIQGGADKIHVISDFDRTITYGLTGEGKRTATVISQLRSDPKYLGDEYQKEAYKLFDIYHPIEIDNTISLEEKKVKMHEWWKKHFDLIATVNLTKDLIKQVVKEKPLNFRQGSLEFISLLDKNNIPLVFMSAAPGDMIKEYLKANNLTSPDVYVIANLYDFNEKGEALKIREPIIHTFNKTEVSLKGTPAFEKVKDRKNVLLLGDSLGDIGMIEGFEYDTLIKVGFLNENVAENLEAYKKDYDVVIAGDGDMNFINKLLGEILR